MPGSSDLAYAYYARAENAMDAALHNLQFSLFDLEFALFKANFNPSQPRIPAGSPQGGRWVGVGANDYEAISKLEKWGDSLSLKDHVERHGKDFNAKSAHDYARQARKFYERGVKVKLPNLAYPKRR